MPEPVMRRERSEANSTPYQLSEARLSRRKPNRAVLRVQFKSKLRPPTLASILCGDYGQPLHAGAGRRMSTAPKTWFPFYVGDYLRDTSRLSTEAHGAYLLLILDYWPNGAPPDDNETLASITKLSMKAWMTMRPRLEPFFVVADGRWTHKRIEHELLEAEHKHRKRAEAGKLGGKSKASGKQNPSNASSKNVAEGCQSQSQSQRKDPQRGNVSSFEVVDEDTGEVTMLGGGRA
jgi:uncharacterized protein YdaU (DUF1376 family)